MHTNGLLSCLRIFSFFSVEIHICKSQLSCHMVLLFSTNENCEVWVRICVRQEVGQWAGPWLCRWLQGKLVFVLSSIVKCWRLFNSKKSPLVVPSRTVELPLAVVCGYCVPTEGWGACVLVPLSDPSAPLTLGADRMQNNILRKFDSWGCCASLYINYP